MRKFNVFVDGIQYNVEIEEVGAGAPAAAPQIESKTATVAAPAPAAAPKLQPAEQPKAIATPGNGYKMAAPLPGDVVKLTKNNGDTVKKGEVIMIIEAMKMENEIASEADGVITYAVDKGAKVQSGDVLAYIA